MGLLSQRRRKQQSLYILAANPSTKTLRSRHHRSDRHTVVNHLDRFARIVVNLVIVDRWKLVIVIHQNRLEIHFWMRKPFGRPSMTQLNTKLFSFLNKYWKTRTVCEMRSFFETVPLLRDIEVNILLFDRSKALTRSFNLTENMLDQSTKSHHYIR